MINKNKKLLLLFFLIFLLFGNFRLTIAKDVMFSPQIGIPSIDNDGMKIEPGEQINITPESFIEYIITIYKWSVNAIAIIAIIMTMIAGFQWMTAVGNAPAIGQAKSRINNSLVGLLLAVGAYSLLNFINPSLVNLKGLGLENVDYVDLKITEVTCSDSGKKVYSWIQHECFDMGSGRDSSTSYSAVGDMGINDIIKTDIIDNISIDFGVDENHAEGVDCDFDNNYNDIDKKETAVSFDSDHGCPVAEITGPGTRWSACLTDGATETWYESTSSYCDCVHKNIDPNLDFYHYIPDGGAGIWIQAKFSGDNFEGIEVKTASQDGHSSAYFANVVINTNEWCAVCCENEGSSNETSDVVEFGSTLICSNGWTVTNSSKCCEKVAEKDCDELTFYQCVGVKTLCGDRCHWNTAAGSCQEP